MVAIVTFVSRSARHRFSKQNELVIRLIGGIGIEGDTHAGKAVQHSYSRRKNVEQPNPRQVHLVQEELFDSLARDGFSAGQALSART
jgi:hypothetical protein